MIFLTFQNQHLFHIYLCCIIQFILYLFSPLTFMSIWIGHHRSFHPCVLSLADSLQSGIQSPLIWNKYRHFQLMKQQCATCNIRVIYIELSPCHSETFASITKWLSSWLSLPLYWQTKLWNSLKIKCKVNINPANSQGVGHLYIMSKCMK